MQPDYRCQHGCHDCRHVVCVYDYDEPERLYCGLDAPPRPRCGSVGMNELWYDFDRDYEATIRHREDWEYPTTEG